MHFELIHWNYSFELNQTNQLKIHFCYLTFDDIRFNLFPLILASCERREHNINDSLHAWPNKNALELLLH